MCKGLTAQIYTHFCAQYSSESVHLTTQECYLLILPKNGKIRDLNATLEGSTHIFEGNGASIMCREPQSWYTVLMFVGIFIKHPWVDLEQYGGYQIILGRYLKKVV